MTGSTNNTWGLGFTETFDVFGSTANGNPSFYGYLPAYILNPTQVGAGGRGLGQDLAAHARALGRIAAVVLAVWSAEDTEFHSLTTDARSAASG